MRVLVVVLALLLSGCPYFLKDIPCEEDSETCPFGLACGPERVCVDPDTLVPDGGVDLDAGRPIPDVVRVDAGRPDAGQPDAGQPDAGQPDGGVNLDGGPDGDGGVIVVDAGADAGQCAFARLAPDGDSEVNLATGFTEDFAPNNEIGYTRVAGPDPIVFDNKWTPDTLPARIDFVHGGFQATDAWRLRATVTTPGEAFATVSVLDNGTLANEINVDGGNILVDGTTRAFPFPSGTRTLHLEMRRSGAVDGGTLSLFADPGYARLVEVLELDGLGAILGPTGYFEVASSSTAGSGLEDVRLHSLNAPALAPQGLLYSHTFAAPEPGYPASSIPTYFETEAIGDQLRTIGDAPGLYSAALDGSPRRLRATVRQASAGADLTVDVKGLGFMLDDDIAGVRVSIDEGDSFVDLGGFGTFEVEIVYLEGASVVTGEVRCAATALADCPISLPIHLGCAPLSAPSSGDGNLVFDMSGPSDGTFYVDEIFVYDR